MLYLDGDGYMKNEKSSKQNISFDPKKKCLLDLLIENEVNEIIVFFQKRLSTRTITEILKDDTTKHMLFDLIFKYFLQNYNKIFTTIPSITEQSFNLDREKLKTEDCIQEKTRTDSKDLNASFFTENVHNYSIIKCSIKDNELKPRTVSDLRLAINIPSSLFFSSPLLYQATAEYLFGNILKKYYMDIMEEEIKTLDSTNLADLKIESRCNSDLVCLDVLIKKMKELSEEVIDLQAPVFTSKYSILLNVLIENITQINESDVLEACNKNLKNVEKKIDLELLRDDAFSLVSKMLASIIDSPTLGYQYIENIKKERFLLLREYEDEDKLSLPDERYQIELIYYDLVKLAERRQTYRNNVFSCANKTDHLLSIVDSKLYGDAYSLIINSHEDLQENYKNYVRECLMLSSNKEAGDTFFPSSMCESTDKAFASIKSNIRKNFDIIQQRINEIYGQKYTIDKRILEDRLSSLKKELNNIDSLVNPFYLVPGFLLNVHATSIKRKCTTFTALQSVITTWTACFDKNDVFQQGITQKKAITKQTTKRTQLDNIKVITEKEDMKDKPEIKEDEEKKTANIIEREAEIKQEVIEHNTKGEQTKKRGRPKKDEDRKNIKRRNRNPKQTNLLREI